MLVGVTGGIGTGKTTVCKVFSVLGIPVYNADLRAREISDTNPSVRRRIVAEFGEKSYSKDGKLHRSWMAQHVFGDAARLAKLNNILHPAVGEDFKKWIRANTGPPYLIKEAALLIEAGSYRDLDKLIVVTSPMDLRIGRVLKRDPQRNEQQIRAIIASQLPDEEKEKFADFVIRNDNSDLIVPAILKLHSSLAAEGAKLSG